jgi:outer membrane protein assembly factor BamB
VQQQQGVIELWDKSKISLGGDTDKAIQQHLATARVFLLLISSDFLAESYCYDQVLKAALEKHTRGDALVIPVIVRPANWQDVGVLKRIPVLPKNGQPISGRSDQENALWEVTQEINKAIQGMDAPLVEPNREPKNAPYRGVSFPQTGNGLNTREFPMEQPSVTSYYPMAGEGKVSSPLRPEQKKINVLLVLAVLIILGGGTAFALFANHPGSSSRVTFVPTSTHTPPIQQPSLKWAKPPGAIDSSPTVVNGVLYVGSWYTVYALDANTGLQKWTFLTGNRVESSPTVVNGVLYVGSQDGNVYALDANTGQKKWSFTTGGGVDSSPLVLNGVLYVGSDDHNVYALDANTGQKKWSFTTGSRVYSSPTVVNGVLYIASMDGNVYILDASTGLQKLAIPMGGTASSPKVLNGVLYVGSGDHNVYAFDATTGQQKWAFTTGDGLISSPTVVNGVLYIGSVDHKVYALDAKTGHEIWAFQTLGVVRSSPTVQGGVLYIGSGDGDVTPDDHDLYALDASTGQQKWVFPTGGYVRCSPKIFDGVLYFGSGDGKMYAWVIPVS